MCAGAIAHTKIRRLYYGAADAKGGAVESGVKFFDSDTCHHKPEIYSGIAASECEKILKDFFRKLR